MFGAVADFLIDIRMENWGKVKQEATEDLCFHLGDLVAPSLAFGTFSVLREALGFLITTG